jgi:hypothetical protein
MDWVDLRGGLNPVTKKKISDPGEKRVSAGVKPVASHFTD